MTKISFVYFDVGGVLIKDFSVTNKWEEMLLDLGIKENNFDKFNGIYDRHARQINTHLEIDKLLPQLSKEFGIEFPKNYSWLDDFIARFEVNPHITPIVKQLNMSYKLGLLTNMWPGMLDKIFAADLMPPATWQVIVDSTIVDMQKPDREIYEYAQDKAGVPASEILFIDNTPKHLIEPKQLGWQTFFYDSRNYAKSTHELANFLGLSGE
ncbi:MAG: HAD family hydrolase [bacterium]